MEYQKKFSQNPYSDKISAGDTWNKNGNIRDYKRCCGRVTIPRSPDLSKLMNAWCIPQPYESGALTS